MVPLVRCSRIFPHGSPYWFPKLMSESSTEPLFFLQYSKDVSRKFEGMKVDLRGIILLESEGKQNLISFTETGINEIDFAAYLEEVHTYMNTFWFKLLNHRLCNYVLWVLVCFCSSFQVNKGVTRIDLVDFARKLDAQADQLVRFMIFIRFMCGLIIFFKGVTV